MPIAPRNNQGFSLVEVLIALFILGLVLGATSQLVGTSLQNMTALEANMFGSWVAHNQISLAQLNKLPEGESSGETTMAGRQWHWKQTIKASTEPALLEIVVEVNVNDKPDNRVAIEHGFRLAP